MDLLTDRKSHNVYPVYTYYVECGYSVMLKEVRVYQQHGQVQRTLCTTPWYGSSLFETVVT